MKERPILFSPAMVRAILEGQKTQTRRVVKPTQSAPKVAPLHMEPYLWQGEQETDDNGLPMWIGTHPDYSTEDGKWFSCPYGGIGDRLWVREAWATVKQWDDRAPSDCHPNERAPMLWYKADPQNSAHALSENRGKPRPAMFMPRWASRITLEITGVRVERLQDISEEDVSAEGIPACLDCDAYIDLHRNDIQHWDEADYAALWDSINGKTYPWSSNPWVWVISFRRVSL